MSPEERWVFSSLPRIVTTQIQCSFGTYFWEMYTFEFGWSPAEYGKVQSLFNKTQGICFIILGIVYFLFDVCFGSTSVDDAERQVVLGLIMIGALGAAGTINHINLGSYFLLVYWPVGWYKIETLLVDSMFGKESNFWSAILIGPVKSFAFIQDRCRRVFIEVLYIPCRLVWILLYPFMKLFWMLIHMKFTSCGNCILVTFRGLSLFFKGIFWYLLWVPMKVIWAAMATGLWRLFLGPYRSLREKQQIGEYWLPPYNKVSEHKETVWKSSKDFPYTTIKTGGWIDDTALNTIHKLWRDLSAVPNVPSEYPLVEEPTRSFMDRVGSLVMLLSHTPKPKISTIASNQTPTTKLQAMHAFMKTRKGIVYTLVAIHGVSMSLYELGTQALPAKAVEPSQIGKFITVNMMVFTVANLFVIWLFSIIRYLWQSKTRLTETFMILSILFNLLQLPLLLVFVEKLAGKPNSAGFLVKEGFKHGAFPFAVRYSLKVETVGNKNKVKVDPNNTATQGDASSCYWRSVLQFVQLVCFLIFHSTVFFWIFTGGPLTFYVSTNILGDNNFYRAFGVPAILIGFAFAQNIPGVLTLIGTGDWLDYARQPDFNNVLRTDSTGTAASHTDAQKAVQNTLDTNYKGLNSRRILLLLVVTGQFFTLLVFKPFDYSWNKSKWLNYIILIMTGVVNTLFLSYTYVCMGLSIGLKCWKMLIYGPFYAIMGLNVSKAMGVMFQSFGADEIRKGGCWCFSFNYHNCFPNVYKTITKIFWAANFITLVAACTCSVFVFKHPAGLLNTGYKPVVQVDDSNPDSGETYKKSSTAADNKYVALFYPGFSI